MGSQRIRHDWVTFTYMQWDQRAVSCIRIIRRPKMQEAKSLDGFPCVSAVKNLPAKQETWVQSLGWEDALEEGMATYSNILAWRILWTEEPGRLQSMGSQRVGQGWSDSAHIYYGEGNGNPLQYSSLENFMGRGTWQAAVHGVAKSWTQLDY